MISKDATATPVSMIEQTSDSLLLNAQRLRCAYPSIRQGEWSEPVVESEATLLAVAEKVERFRLSLLRFARQESNSRTSGKVALV
jgi:hypothetical protein